MRVPAVLLAGGFALAFLATGSLALAQGQQQDRRAASRACEELFRQCVAACGGGPPGDCTNQCYGERAMCLQDPSRANQGNSSSRRRP